jgi:hypothetical protein
MLRLFSGANSYANNKTMKTFYSILSLNIKPEINERLSVGMLMICEKKVLFHFSKQKLSNLQKLIRKDVYSAALDYLKMVERSFRQNENMNQANDIQDSRIFCEPYIEYLSRYNNNLVTFGKPNFIDLEFTEQLFKTMFRKLVDDSAFEVVTIEKKIIDQFKKRFFPDIKPYFNIEKEIDAMDFPGLITPVKVDLLGKNGIETLGQTIDFEKRIHSIEFNIGNLLQLSRAMPKAKKFILGFEPDRKIEINHRIWSNLRSIPEFEYIDISEAEKLTDYARNNNVTPLFDQ